MCIRDRYNSDCGKADSANSNKKLVLEYVFLDITFVTETNILNEDEYKDLLIEQKLAYNSSPYMLVPD